MWTCFCCGENAVYWMSDFDSEDYGYEVAGIVSNYTCGNCGAEYEVFLPIGDGHGEDDQVERGQVDTATGKG